MNQNHAVEAVDQLRSRIDGLRDGMLDLHRMATEVINEDYGDRPTRGKNRSGNWRRCAPPRCWSSPTACAPRYTQSKNWRPSLPTQTGTKSNGITSLHFLCPFLQELWSYAYFNVGRNVGICWTSRTPEYYFFAVIA